MAAVDWAYLIRCARMHAATRGINPNDAEDVAQEAVIKVWRALKEDQLDERAQYTYLHLTVLSVIIDRARVEDARRRHNRDWAILISRREASTEVCAELNDAICTLAQMGEIGRACLLSASGYSAREIGELLQVPGRTADSWVRRARGLL